MYQRMLVPLDGSKPAEVVFPYVKELAGRLDLEVILLLVTHPAVRDFVPMQRAYIEQVAKTVRRQSREVQTRIGIQPGGKRIRVRGELAEGYPAEEILRYAEKNTVDLILIAAYGRSGARRWAIGSVADKVLRASKVPVLLVRAGTPDETPYDQWPRKTILVLLDGSELAESVLPHAEALAKQRDTELIDVVLLRVCEPLVTPAYSMAEFGEPTFSWGAFMQQDMAKNKEVTKEYLAGAEKRFKDIDVRVQSKVLVGRAADEIVDYVNKNPFNLIVMATHGRSGLRRWVYGSVADNVLQAVTSPILVVRPH